MLNVKKDIPRNILYQKYVIEKKSIIDIKNELNICNTTIYNYLNKYNIPIRIKKFNISKNILFQKYIIEEKSLRTIAKELDTSNSIIYEYFKKYKIPIRSISEAKKGKNHPMYGKHHSKETKIKMSESHKKIKMLPLSEGHKKKISITLKGRIPWNKGLTKEIDERVKNISKNLEGKESWCKGLKGEEYLKHFKDEKVWNKGIPHSEETRKRISESRKGKLTGENHPLFNNWSSKEPYGIEFDEKLKEQIRQRDNYRCQQCFRHQDELFAKYKNGKIIKYNLIIHHIDYNKKNNNPNNLISLCLNCHTQTNFKRNNWTNYFQNKLQGDLK